VDAATDGKHYDFTGKIVRVVLPEGDYVDLMHTLTLAMLKLTLGGELDVVERLACHKERLDRRNHIR
jgi:hypothetical protein